MCESGPFGPYPEAEPYTSMGVNFFQRLVADTEAFGHTLPEVLNENVCLLHQLVDDVHAFTGLEVEGYATLVPVVCLEVGIAVAGEVGTKGACPAQAASGIAVQGLDLDYVGSHVAHHGSGHGAKLPYRPVQYPDALQRSAGPVNATIAHTVSP